MAAEYKRASLHRVHGQGGRSGPDPMRTQEPVLGLRLRLGLRQWKWVPDGQDAGLGDCLHIERRRY